MVNVINSGRVGDTIPDNLARFGRDVLAHTPDLVVWQLGTNDVAWAALVDHLNQENRNNAELASGGGGR
jgi:acyl-CoA thioesterase-1